MKIKRVSTFGIRLKQLRKKRGLSQPKLSEEVPTAPKSSIAEWELGNREPKIEVVIDLAKFFGVSVGYMAGVEETPPE